MAGRDEDRFRVKPGPPKSRGDARPQRFVSQVLTQVSKAGGKRSGRNAGKPASTFGRGRVAATMAGHHLDANARRVIIKSRFVVLRRASPNSVVVHLRYIERDGVTRDGRKGQAYGRAHYLRLPAGADLAELPANAVVEVKPPGQGKGVDRDIAAMSVDGIYSTANHLAQLKQSGHPDPQVTIDVHVRRLEALRRVGVVEHMANSVWKIPDDFLQQAQQRDAQKRGGWAVELRSRLSIERQIRAVGATWLERNLVADGRVPHQGFGAQVHDAMQARVDFLAEQGLAERRGQRVLFARNLLATLRDRELATAGKRLEDQTGLSYRPLQDGQEASGIYRRSVQLNSGRFALLDDGRGFSLVPWRPVIEQRLGQRVSGVVRGASVSWHIGRQRGPSV